VPRPLPHITPPIRLERDAPTPRKHDNELLTGRVRLDNASFTGCTFRRATLVYAGMGPTQLGGCTFEDTQFEFDGPAANALGFLQAMSHPASGLRDVVRASFPKIFAH
jgi:hypothetical protein